MFKRNSSVVSLSHLVHTYYRRLAPAVDIYRDGDGICYLHCTICGIAEPLPFILFEKVISERMEILLKQHQHPKCPECL